jgi:hypothetical protein
MGVATDFSVLIGVAGESVRVLVAIGRDITLAVAVGTSENNRGVAHEPAQKTTRRMPTIPIILRMGIALRGRLGWGFRMT